MLPEKYNDPLHVLVQTIQNEQDKDIKYKMTLVLLKNLRPKTEGFIYSKFGKANAYNYFDEAYNEASLSLFKFIDGFRFESSIQTWFTKVCVNDMYTILNKLNDKKDNDQVLYDNASKFQKEIDFDSPDMIMESTQTIEHLNHAVKTLLTESEQDIFRMRYKEDLEFEEIAKRKGIKSIITVKTRLTKIKAKLLKSFDDR